MTKIAVFVDGNNIHATTKKLGMEIDYKKLLEHLGSSLVFARYYSSVKPRTDMNDPLIPLLDWLDYNGFRVVKKETKEFTDEVTGRQKIKGNMDIEIAVDALTMTKDIDNVWLFTGDGDFKALVDALHQNGKRVTVVSSIVVPQCADELRRVADVFIELREFIPLIEAPVKKKYT